MSDFSVRVVRISEPVVDHPGADRLSLIKIAGFTCIANKLEDGSHRYRQGDYVVYVPEGALVPEYLLRRGFWNDEKGHGILAGSNHDRVKAIRLRQIFSQGILFPVQEIEHSFYISSDDETISVEDGDDVAAFLRITKYEPPIPAAMAGITFFMGNGPVKFDFESIQTLPDLFESGELVNVTEKAHGTHFGLGYIHDNRNEFGFCEGEIYVNSKGLGSKGLVFKDVPENDGNVYVRMLRKLLDGGFHERVKALSVSLDGQAIRVFGEIVGQGVQDLSYGFKDPTPLVFDIKVGDTFLTPAQTQDMAAALGLTFVPILATGPFDLEWLIHHRDGRDTISHSHVREGIVIRAMAGTDHPVHGRKIGKWVSPDYLLRKGNATEHQ